MMYSLDALSERIKTVLAKYEEIKKEYSKKPCDYSLEVCSDIIDKLGVAEAKILWLEPVGVTSLKPKNCIRQRARWKYHCIITYYTLILDVWSKDFMFGNVKMYPTLPTYLPFMFPKQDVRVETQEDINDETGVFKIHKYEKPNS